MRSPLCIIIGDIHFTPSTLELATDVVKQAKHMAHMLKVPLVLNGDTLDGKDLIRGVCANRLMEIIDSHEDRVPAIYVNVGNHDLINVKSSEHSLNFLKPICNVIQVPTFLQDIESYIIPYQTSPEALQAILSKLPKGSCLIMHQGLQTANMGHYRQDTSSLPKNIFADFRVVASHYHCRQDIQTADVVREGQVGMFSYVGSPYTITAGEAQDEPKGYSVLYSDGTLTHVPTNIRKHVTVVCTSDEVLNPIPNLDSHDILWLKVTGSQLDLDRLDKKAIGEHHLGHANYKLDLIPNATLQTHKETENLNLNDFDMLDKIIDNTAVEPSHKTELKSLWRELMS
jgi:hypothetical protein